MMKILPDEYKNIHLANGEALSAHRSVRSLTVSSDDPLTLPLPDPRLLELQSKLASAWRSFYVEQIIKTDGLFKSDSKPSGMNLSLTHVPPF